MIPRPFILSDLHLIPSPIFHLISHHIPADLDAIVHLASNTVSPAYEGLELGIGDSLLVKAICEATGRKKDQVEKGMQCLVAHNTLANTTVVYHLMLFEHHLMISL